MLLTWFYLGKPGENPVVLYSIRAFHPACWTYLLDTAFWGW
jgi:hypothetical protein